MSQPTASTSRLPIAGPSHSAPQPLPRPPSSSSASSSNRKSSRTLPWEMSRRGSTSSDDEADRRASGTWSAKKKRLSGGASDGRSATDLKGKGKAAERRAMDFSGASSGKKPVRPPYEAASSSPSRQPSRPGFVSRLPPKEHPVGRQEQLSHRATPSTSSSAAFASSSSTRRANSSSLTSSSAGPGPGRPSSAIAADSFLSSLASELANPRPPSRKKPNPPPGQKKPSSTELASALKRRPRPSNEMLYGPLPPPPPPTQPRPRGSDFFAKPAPPPARDPSNPILVQGQKLDPSLARGLFAGHKHESQKPLFPPSGAGGAPSAGLKQAAAPRAFVTPVVERSVMDGEDNGRKGMGPPVDVDDKPWTLIAPSMPDRDAMKKPPAPALRDDSSPPPPRAQPARSAAHHPHPRQSLFDDDDDELNTADEDALSTAASSVVPERPLSALKRFRQQQQQQQQLSRSASPLSAASTVDEEDSSDDEIVVSSTSASTSVSGGVKLEVKPRVAKGKKDDKGKGKVKAQKDEGKGKAKADPPPPKRRRVVAAEEAKKTEEECWTEMDCEEAAGIKGVVVPEGWRPPEPETLTQRPKPTIGSLRFTLNDVVFHRKDVVTRVEAGSWVIRMLVEIASATPGSRAAFPATEKQVRMVPCTIPSLPAEYQTFKPFPPRYASIAFDDFPLPAEPVPLNLRVELIDVGSVLSFTHPLTASSITGGAVSTRLSCPGALSSDAYLGPSVRASFVPSTPPPAPTDPEAVLDSLRAAIDRMELERDLDRWEGWVPDAVRVEVPGFEKGKGQRGKGKGKEKALVGGGGKGEMLRLSGDRAGYDFMTKEAYEPGERVKPWIRDTVESTRPLVKEQEQRLVSSGITCEKRLLHRCEIRFALLNPYPLSPAYREIACWRFYAPLVHHYSLRPQLGDFLIERFAKGVLDRFEFLDILEAYDREVERIEAGERVGYEEWRRRVRWKEEQAKVMKGK